jgi:hypothetical protein
MKEKPIIFSTPMVQAILDGRKTMTRRVVNEPSCTDNNGTVNIKGFWVIPERDRDHFFEGISPYSVEDRLWVRETWRCDGINDGDMKALITYKSTGEMAWVKFTDPERYHKCVLRYKEWRPSIFMFRETSRIFLEVKHVRLERIQAITNGDVKSEGWPESFGTDGLKIKYIGPYCDSSSYSTQENEVCSPDFCHSQDCFSAFWNKLNKKRGFGWEDNPWVYVYEFERVKP